MNYIFDYQIVSGDNILYAHLHKNEIPKDIQIDNKLNGIPVEIRIVLYDEYGEFIDMYRRYTPISKTILKHILIDIPLLMLNQLN